MTQRKIEEGLAETRIDQWLWAARFFKTRALAAEAIDGGKVQVNGNRAKRSKTVRCGDRVRIRKAAYEWTVAVTAISERRGTAAQAATLYDELAESRAAREAVAEQHRLAAALTAGHQAPAGRPTKRDRRRLSQIKRGR